MKHKDENTTVKFGYWKYWLGFVAVTQMLMVLGYHDFSSSISSWSILPTWPVPILTKNKEKLNVHIGNGARHVDKKNKTNSRKITWYDKHNSAENNPAFEHTWEHNPNDDSKIHGIVQNSIAIGMGITSMNNRWNSDKAIFKTFPFFKSLLPTFCKTASKGYNYNFFMAYDADDAFYTNQSNLYTVQKLYYTFIGRNCPKESNFSIHFVLCSHSKQPARAQNDAMMAAYMSNMEYYYRINDDTKMKTPGWTKIFIDTLRKFSPPNVGVVGPNHRGGNTNILTYDFVHYTHIHIHGFYYPRVWMGWYADGWITNVYLPDRSVKVKSVRLVHTAESGRRYIPHRKNDTIVNKQKMLVASGKERISRYIAAIQKEEKPDKNKVIAFSLAGQNPTHTYGAIRNLQLWPVIFPTWRIRVYILDQIISTNHINISRDLLVPQQVINKLRLLGADIVFLNSSYINTPYCLWKYLVADDPQVRYFMVRNSDRRISERGKLLSQHWLNRTNDRSGGNTMFCVRDNKSQNPAKHLVLGLFGAHHAVFKNNLERINVTSIANLIVSSHWRSQLANSGKKIDFSNILATNLDGDYQQKLNDVEDYFLNYVLWPAVKDITSCYDDAESLNRKTSNSVNIPLSILKLNDSKPLSTVYNEFEEVIK